MALKRQNHNQAAGSMHLAPSLPSSLASFSMRCLEGPRRLIGIFNTQHTIPFFRSIVPILKGRAADSRNYKSKASIPLSCSCSQITWGSRNQILEKILQLSLPAQEHRATWYSSWTQARESNEKGQKREMICSRMLILSVQIQQMLNNTVERCGGHERGSLEILVTSYRFCKKKSHPVN